MKTFLRKWYPMAMTAVVFSNLMMFGLILSTGESTWYEPNMFILGFEITVCVLLIAWGLTRIWAEWIMTKSLKN